MKPILVLLLFTLSAIFSTSHVTTANAPDASIKCLDGKGSLASLRGNCTKCLVDHPRRRYLCLTTPLCEYTVGHIGFSAGAIYWRDEVYCCGDWDCCRQLKPGEEREGCPTNVTKKTTTTTTATTMTTTTIADTTDMGIWSSGPGFLLIISMLLL